MLMESGADTRYALPYRPVKPLLTICELKAKSAEHVEHLRVSGWIFRSFGVWSGSAEVGQPSFMKLGEKYEGVGGVSGLSIELDRTESVGDEPKDGVEFSLGGFV